MDESLLVEQLNRMRAMVEWMSRARVSVQDVSDLIARDREEMRQNPLYQVKDLRIEQPYDPLDAPRRSTGSRASSRRRRRGEE